MNSNGVLFLMYHEIESAGRPPSNQNPGYVRYVVTENEFRRQLQAMRDERLRGVSVGEALNNIKANMDSYVALTFDDGCETDLLVAAPILRDADFNATLFVIAGFVGTPGFLDRNQLLQLHKAGFEIGSHTMTHRHLTDLDDDQLRDELQVSKDRLEQMIGYPVVHLSCPNGRYNERVMHVAKQIGYQTISTSRIGRNFSQTDSPNFARFAVMRDTPIEEFFCILRGTRLLRYKGKAAILDLAKRSLGNNVYDKLRAMLLG